MLKSKTMSLFVVTAVYAAAFFTGLLFFSLIDAPSIWRYLFADAAATVVVWGAGLIFINSSLYDPYWSVAPPVLFVCFLLEKGFADAADILLLCVLLIWGVRLTANWIIGWRGMEHQDWRYTMLKEKNRKLWHITNFFGINMMPTLIVFANMVPAYYAANAQKTVNWIIIAGAAVCVSAVLLQIFSDWQMRTFRTNAAQKGQHIEIGLWKFSRHPNYLGEVAFWWGIYIIQIGAVPHWWTAAAPVLMTLLFVFISIPMMEKRLLETKQGYGEYKKSTSMLLLLPRKSIKS